MTLEAAAYYPHDVLTYSCKDLYSLAAALTSDFRALDSHEQEIFVEESKMADPLDFNYELELGGAGSDHALCENGWEFSSFSMVQNIKWEMNSSPETACAQGSVLPGMSFSSVPDTAGPGRRKRRRTKTCKNKEEVENQRMTHIAVERNRRKQMNEYLAVLRSLMPTSYVHRGDQASIIGGAINFVKELEQLLQSLEAQKRITQQPDQTQGFSPFADFFTFPQYSSSSNTASSNDSVSMNRSSIADIEVTMVESHASLKVLSRKRPKQLLKMVVGLQTLHLTVLHLNVTTIDQMVLYSFSLKVEDNCGSSSVDEIAKAVHQIIEGIQSEEEAQRSLAN